MLNGQIYITYLINYFTWKNGNSLNKKIKKVISV